MTTPESQSGMFKKRLDPKYTHSEAQPGSDRVRLVSLSVYFQNEDQPLETVASTTGHLTERETTH